MPRSTPCLLLVIAVVASVATGDHPSTSYIFPAGGQQGTTVEFHVGGHYLHDSCPLEMLGPGLTASERLVRAGRTTWFEGPLVLLPASQAGEDYPVDMAGSVTIAADARLGARRWRVRTSQGAVPSREFIVGQLPEIVEDEIDGNPIPQEVTLPLTINGRIFPREDVDLWQFQAQAGKRYTVEVVAQRLGSPLDSRIEVIGPGGQRIAENGDWFGNDSFLRFTAAEEGLHTVRISDASRRGLQHYVYRLTMTGQVYLDHVYPLGGQRGRTVNLSLFGQELPERPVELAIPPEAPDEWVVDLGVDDMALGRRRLHVTDFPEVVESDQAAAATHSLPVVLNGKISAAGQEDRWRFTVAKGQKIELEIWASRLGSLLDSHLALHDTAGEVMAENDDIADGNTDSKIQVTVSEDGTYNAIVRDRFQSRGGEQFSYRLVARPAATPSPALRLNLAVDTLTVLRASEVTTKVTAERAGGWSGEIELAVAGLPEGVSVEGMTIPTDNNEAELKFTVDDKAKIEVVRLDITGTATVDDGKSQEGEAQEGEATAGAGEAVQLTATALKSPEDPGDEGQDFLLLAVGMPTPFKIRGDFETRYAPRGSSYRRSMFIDRNGFEGPIHVRLAERQVRHLQGLRGNDVVVPSDATEFTFQIQLAPWMEIGRTCRSTLMGVGVVTDHDGSEHTVSFTSADQFDQIIVLVDAARMSVTTTPNSVVFAPGETFPMQIAVLRGPQLKGDVSVQLVVPEHIDGVRADPIVIPADHTEGELLFQFQNAPATAFNMPLTVRARLDEGEAYHTAEDYVEIVNSRSP